MPLAATGPAGVAGDAKDTFAGAPSDRARPAPDRLDRHRLALSLMRQIDREGPGWRKLFGKAGEQASDAGQAPARKAREKRFRMDRDSRRGMGGGGMPAGYAAAGPLTLEELLARLSGEQRSAVLAMTVEQQDQLLRTFEAFDRHLQAPGPYKAAVLERLGRALVNGRLLADRRAHGGLLARLAGRLGCAPAGPLRGRIDGLMLLSQVVLLLAEPRPGPAAGRDTREREVAALTNSLALGWPARWAEIALALACDGSWQGVAPVLRPGGSPPDGLMQGSLLAWALALPREGANAATGDLSVGQLDLLGRVLETDRGAEIDVPERDPAWALEWLSQQLAAGVPARAGMVHDGKGLTTRILALSDRTVACEGGLELTRGAFLAGLRRAIADGEYLSRIGLV